MPPYPKLVALDTDWTIFWGWLNINKIGKRPYALIPAEDNIEQDNGSKWVLRDRTNHNERWCMYQDVPKIIHDIRKHGAKLAIVSRNESKPACDRVLWWWKATDPTDNREKPIIEMVDFNEIYDEDKTVHMKRIQGWTGYDYADMILFDDEATNNLVRVVQGVIFQVSRDQKGLTWENYQRGINQWQEVHKIRSPYLGQNLKSYSDPMFIGFAGMDEGTVNLLTQGKNRVDLKEAARWGYAMYICDDARIAKYFSNWIKLNAFGIGAKTYVCELWARDRTKFLATHKIWVPEDRSKMTSVQRDGRFKIAWDQENRDDWVAEYGVEMPYILFSRHWYMTGMLPITPKTRWSEMVVYTHVQDALMLTIPLTDHQVEEKIALGGQFVKFEEQISHWNITVPDDTWADFRKHYENFRH